jgi:tetratricopeptide (TPR) repeat protein
MTNLALSYQNLGRPADAIKLQEEALALQRSRVGPNHPDVLNGMMNLANTYGMLGRHTEALNLNKETLAVMKTKLGPDDYRTLGTTVNLGESYANLGQTAEAIKVYEDALLTMKSKIPDHRFTFICMSKLAESYYTLGRYAEALKLNREAFGLRTAKLGHNHPHTITSMSQIGRCKVALCQFTEGLKLCEEALTLAKAKLNPNDDIIANTTYNIAGAYGLMVEKSDDRAKQANIAMDWLKRAVAAGFTNVGHMKKDNDLDALRDRDDFKKLMAELEAARAQPPKPEPRPADKVNDQRP